MRMKSWKYIVAAGVLATLVGTGSAFAQFVQAPASPQGKVPVALEQNPKFSDENAERTRNTFQRLLESQPPSLRRVLQLDPWLLTNPDYLAPYAQVSAFLQQHPEIAHNPMYFLGNPDYTDDFSRYRERSNNGRAIEQVFIFAIFLVIGGTILWAVRAFIDHRRWLRLSRLQTEANNKLMERFHSTDELLNFIQTPAGTRLMESSVVPVEPRAVGAPVNRILWSAQIGLVLLAIGTGLEFASRRGVDAESAAVFDSLGILIIAAGVGFVASGLLSYLLSQKMGLLEPLRATPMSGGGAAPKPS